MRSFKVLFWKTPFVTEIDFVPDTNTYITSATVTQTIDDLSDIFHIKLNDIGLNSLFGEFDIIRKNGYWQTTDKDGAELNFLKWNIICSLEFQMEGQKKHKT